MTPDELSISCQKPKSLAQRERCANRAQSQLFSHFSSVITLQSGPFANRPDKLGKRWAGWAKPIFHTNEQICDKKSQKKKKKKKKTGASASYIYLYFILKLLGPIFFFFFFSFFVFLPHFTSGIPAFNCRIHAISIVNKFPLVSLRLATQILNGAAQQQSTPSKHIDFQLNLTCSTR